MRPASLPEGTSSLHVQNIIPLMPDGPMQVPDAFLTAFQGSLCLQPAGLTIFHRPVHVPRGVLQLYNWSLQVHGAVFTLHF
jgi:hypothetical protein